MIPRVDPQVKYVGTTYLRSLNSDKLRELSGAVVVQAENSDPLAVILPYETYLKMQQVAGIDDDDFNQQRQEIRSSIERGARQVPVRTLRDKGDAKR